MKSVLISFLSIFFIVSLASAQVAKLPVGAKPLSGTVGTSGELEPLLPAPPYPPPPPTQLPPPPSGGPLYQSNQIIDQPQPISDYKSDLPAGWDAPPQVSPGEIPLEDLTGKQWKPVPVGQGNLGDNVVVEEEVPIYKKSNNNQTQPVPIEEETIEDQTKPKKKIQRWGQ